MRAAYSKSASQGSSQREYSAPLGSALNLVGWDVHVHEGPNNLAIAPYCTCSLLINLVATLLWSILRRDMQGGTGIGQYIVGITTSIYT